MLLFHITYYTFVKVTSCIYFTHKWAHNNIIFFKAETIQKLQLKNMTSVQLDACNLFGKLINTNEQKGIHTNRQRY